MYRKEAVQTGLIELKMRRKAVSYQLLAASQKSLFDYDKKAPKRLRPAHISRNKTSNQESFLKLAANS